MRHRVIRPFTDAVGGKDGAGKGFAYDPSIAESNTFPAEGVEVSPERISELASGQNKLGYAVIQAEEPVNETDQPAEQGPAEEPVKPKAGKKTKQ